MTGVVPATNGGLLNLIGGGAVNGWPSLSLYSGSGQSGNAYYALGQPIVVKVSDAAGNGIAGTTVNFLAVGGNGTVSPTSGVSDSNGLVQTTWTLGGNGGTQTITASTASLPANALVIGALCSGGGCGEELSGISRIALTQAFASSGSSVPLIPSLGGPAGAKPGTFLAVLQSEPHR
jgi:hypothetical protein